jgi:hypothetical protein
VGEDTVRPRLSVTIATRHGWDAVKMAYEPLRHQAEVSCTEVIVLDSSGEAPPPSDKLTPGTRWLSMPDTDLSEMQLHGYREARGRIVAMTEDHCIAAPDWLSAIQRAHDEHPEAAAVGGTVRNGSAHHLVDWASFYAGQAPFLAPQPAGSRPHVCQVNISYKRPALQAAITDPGSAGIETLLNDRLKANGGVLVADDRIVVTHIQCRSALGTARLHYHSGRNFEGKRRLERRGNAYLRAFRAALLPLPRVAKRSMTLLGRGEPRGRVARAAPAMVWLAMAQGFGESVGALLGPGNSDRHLR